jgi:hypothetical protein
MSEPIKPALTPEEWAHLLAGGVIFGVPYVKGGPKPEQPKAFGPHASAALALHDQPFGFTWEDVRRLWNCCIDERGTDTTQEQLDDIADRIAALLPPEER